MPLGGPRRECLGRSQAWQPCNHWGQWWGWKPQPPGRPQSQAEARAGAGCPLAPAFSQFSLTKPGATLVRRKLKRAAEVRGQEAWSLAWLCLCPDAAGAGPTKRGAGTLSTRGNNLGPLPFALIRRPGSLVT